MEARETGKGINANDPLTVHASSYINQFNVERHTAYQALKDACKDLFARQFSYQEKRERGRINITSRWVSQIGYMDDTATVEIIFAPAVVPLITRLEEQFTQYDIEQISELSSAYAVRLYELLICWRSTGKTPIIDLTEFRKRLGVLDTEYTRTDNLKMRVIELGLKQINEHTDITASYEQHKKGEQSQDSHSSLSRRRRKQGRKCQKIAILAHISKNLVKSLPTSQNSLKMPKKDDLGHRASKITGLIMSNGLADRFKRGDESVIDMMKRIKEEITTDTTADQWENKLEEFGVIFQS